MYGGARSASVVLDCDGPVCKLVVGVHTADLEPRGHTDDLMRFEAPVPPGTGPKTWAQIVEAGLLAQVPLPEPAGGLGIGGIAGSRRPGVHAWFQSVEQSGPWTSKLTSAPIQPVKEALHACAGNHSAWNDFWAVDHLLELDDQGFVSRCEDNLPDHLPPPAFSCRCEILRRVAFGPGAPGRRARLNLITTVVKPGPAKEDPHFRNIYFAEPRAEDPSATLGSNGFSRADLRACIANAKPFGHAKAPTALSVDADGQVTAAHIEWPQMVPEDVRACVQASVLRGQLSCPLRGPAKVTGVLDVEVVTLETLRRSRGW